VLIRLERGGTRLKVEPSLREVTPAQRELVIPPAHLSLVGAVGRIAVDRPDEVPRGLAHRRVPVLRLERPEEPAERELERAELAVDEVLDGVRVRVRVRVRS